MNIKNLNKKQDPLLYLFLGGLIFLILALLGCLMWIKHIHCMEVENNIKSEKAYHIANELRRTSDDLTTMIRLYVVTGNKKYIDYYNEIISIRNGESPRPKEYDNVYWDLILDGKRPSPYGKKESLINLMIKNHFSMKEFNLLKKAEALSSTLSQIENKAINAIQGKFDSGNGEYTIQGKPDKQLAMNLVFGKKYMHEKAEIMMPIRKVIKNVSQRTNQQKTKLYSEIQYVISIAIILSILSALIIIISVAKALHKIHKASRENERLLLNILPASIAKRLKSGEKIIADEYAEASVLFCDIVGFTAMMSKLSTAKMFEVLGLLYDEFDTLAHEHGIEKIKTIGDSYMAVSGLPEVVSDHATRLANFALAIRDKVNEFSKKHELEIITRIGLAFGPVIAGVIGHKKFVYDVWGDVVNIASRMESTNLPGKIQITEEMALVLKDTFIIEERSEIEVKGKGKMKTYFIHGHRNDISNQGT